MHLSKITPILMSFVSILGLVSCNNSSSSESNKQDKLSVTYNEYNTYKELANSLLILNKNNPETDTFLFDINIDGLITKYYVAGIDYKKTNLEDASDNTNSFNLKTREIYYELIDKPANLIYTVIFNKKVKYEKDEIIWTNEKLSFNGTVLNYEKNSFGDAYYLRYKDVDLLTLKTNKTDYDLKTLVLIQNYLTNKM